MINVLMCVYKSGDVLGLTLKQFVDCPAISRILIADGPHLGPIKPGHKVDKPTVRDVVRSLKCEKIKYQLTKDCPTRADKNNRILKQVSDDCKWILNVDSDEVYHEDALVRLAKFLKTAEYGRYAIKTVNPYPDLHHCFKVPWDWKPRVYRWFPGAECEPGHDRNHQYVLHRKQKTCKGQERLGVARLPHTLCSMWHLNALRGKHKRVKDQKDKGIIWTGGRLRCESKIYPLDIRKAPKSIRELGKDTLK